MENYLSKQLWQYLSIITIDRPTIPKPGDLDILSGLGLGLGVIFGGVFCYTIYRLKYKTEKKGSKDKIINLDYTIDIVNMMYVIFIFDYNISNNRRLQFAYNLVYTQSILTRVNNHVTITLPEENVIFIIRPCLWYGYSITGIGFSDGCIRTPRYPITFNEALCLYVPCTAKITTATYPSFDIRNYKWCPSSLLPNGGGFWVPGPHLEGYLYLITSGYTLYSGGSPLLTRKNVEGNLEFFIRGEYVFLNS